jgi:hypothetical protein
MNKKFTVLIALIALILIWVASEYLLTIVEKFVEIGLLATITLWIIRVLLMLHILTDVVDLIFEIESRKTLVDFLRRWFGGR